MIKRKDKIIIAALELLEQGGVAHVTTKNLAQKQGISEPALYRQFKNKQGIFEAMIKEYASYDKKIMNTIVEQNMRGREAVIFYIARYAELYSSYSELSSILYSMDLYYYNEKTRDLMKQILNQRDAFLKKQLSAYPVLTCSLKAGELATEINALLFSEVFRWKLDNKNYHLSETLVQKVTKLLEK